MAPLQFSDVLEYNMLTLTSASDIALHSFIAQNSVSHLDLEISRSLRFSAPRRSFSHRRISHYSVINTEENCQKLHSAFRNHLLYRLHLDLPKAREWSLKSKLLPKNSMMLSFSPCVARIEAYGNFYAHNIIGFFQYACENFTDDEKILKWFIECDKLKNCNITYLPERILNRFVDLMLVESADLEFVKQCLTKLPLIDLLSNDTKPERVRDLLYLVHSTGGIAERNLYRCEFSDECFMQDSFKLVGETLKFLNGPHLCRSFFRLFSSGVLEKNRNYRLLESLEEIQPPNSLRRSCLLMHLYWTYLNEPTDPIAASESLRLVWNSVPDSIISKNEITDKFECLGSERIANVYDFYSKAVGEYHEDVALRPLKHLCRSEIRNILWKSNQWLPEGIEQLDIPTDLQSYLKLEM